MKMVLWAVLSGGFVVLTGGLWAGAAEEDAAQKEYARFEGAWKFVSIEIEGKNMPEKFFKGSRLILKGPQFTYQEGGTTYKGTYKVDVSKKPNQIDMTFTEGPEKDKTMVGIYELDGDTYRVCVNPTGKGRPTEFASKPGSGHVLEVLNRVKADSKDKDEAIQKEMAKLEGSWQLISAETDGEKLPEERAKQIRVVIDKGKHTVYVNDKPIDEGVAFRIDPTKTPREVDDTLKDGKKIRGIYELEGDTLRSCVAAAGEERPTKFSGEKGSGCTLRVFKRVTTADDRDKK
jgi:uncharacterized protein (TIGR03067 family)